MASKRSEADKQMAARLKEIGEERWTGKCVICGATIGNDTFGGKSVLEHYFRHARGYQEAARKGRS